MIDHIKIVQNSKTLAESLLSDRRLRFVGRYEHGVYNVLKGVQGKCKGLQISVYEASGRVEIKGSLHKFYNQGEHNYDDFSLQATEQAIYDLTSELGIDPYQARLHNLEFGLNLRLPMPVNDVIANMIAYNNLSLNKMQMIGPGNCKGQIIR